MIIVCDTFDYEDYPVFVKPEEDFDTEYAKYNKNMQKVMEVYNLRKSKDEQFEPERRTWDF